jgi:putative tryptophan/tyrosine transport system substrate-binding protein
VRRREFIAVFAGAAVWPLTGYAQQPQRLVGVMLRWPETDPMAQASKTAFVRALERLGWVESSNIRIDYHFSGGDPGLSTAYAAELVGLVAGCHSGNRHPGSRRTAAADANGADRFRTHR